MKSRTIGWLLFLTCCRCLNGCDSQDKFPPGGYAYPTSLNNKDTGFYLYPLRSLLSRRDSFRHSFDSLIFSFYGEPNLSLRPFPFTIFRLYFTAYKNRNLVITLTPAELTIKRLDEEHGTHIIDKSGLDSLERWQMRFMTRWFGTDYKADTGLYAIRMQYYLDSIRKADPRLDDASYYWHLYRKAIKDDIGTSPLSTVKRPVTSADYEAFVSLLNASGYWQMPYKRECNVEIADGPPYFQLEANTREKYNFVAGSVCPNDTIDFYKACQQLVRLAGVDSEYDVVWIEKPESSDTAKRRPVIVEDIQLEDVKEHSKRHRHKRPTPSRIKRDDP